jgi:hypothetical protein
VTPRILTKLKIKEVSSVDKGAGEGVKIVLLKRDDGEPRPPADDEPPPLASKLQQMVAALCTANPDLSPTNALNFLLHDRRGRTRQHRALLVQLIRLELSDSRSSGAGGGRHHCMAVLGK